MNRTQIALVAVGALTFSVFLLTGGTVAEQKAWMVDAGMTVTHAATCPVRISDDCVDAGHQLGLNVHRNDRLRFPVNVRVLPDAGRDVQMPPMNVGLARACIEVVDWTDCTLDSSAGARTSAAALIGQQLPFDLVGVTKKCVRANLDAGLACLQTDGGSFGDRNVYPRAATLDPAQCESVECAVFLGDDPETDL